MPKTKFIVSVCPNNTADAIPVKIVATVDEYFFNIASAKISVTLSEIFNLNEATKRIYNQYKIMKEINKI